MLSLSGLLGPNAPHKFQHFPLVVLRGAHHHSSCLFGEVPGLFGQVHSHLCACSSWSSSLPAWVMYVSGWVASNVRPNGMRLQSSGAGLENQRSALAKKKHPNKAIHCTRTYIIYLIIYINVQGLLAYSANYGRFESPLLHLLPCSASPFKPAYSSPPFCRRYSPASGRYELGGAPSVRGTPFLRARRRSKAMTQSPAAKSPIEAQGLAHGHPEGTKWWQDVMS